MPGGLFNAACIGEVGFGSCQEVQLDQGCLVMELMGQARHSGLIHQFEELQERKNSSLVAKRF